MITKPTENLTPQKLSVLLPNNFLTEYMYSMPDSLQTSPTRIYTGSHVCGVCRYSSTHRPWEDVMCHVSSLQLYSHKTGSLTEHGAKLEDSVPLQFLSHPVLEFQLNMQTLIF